MPSRRRRQLFRTLLDPTRIRITLEDGTSGSGDAASGALGAYPGSEEQTAEHVTAGALEPATKEDALEANLPLLPMLSGDFESQPTLIDHMQGQLPVSFGVATGVYVLAQAAPGAATAPPRPLPPTVQAAPPFPTLEERTERRRQVGSLELVIDVVGGMDDAPAPLTLSPAPIALPLPRSRLAESKERRATTSPVLALEPPSPEVRATTSFLGTPPPSTERASDVERMRRAAAGDGAASVNAAPPPSIVAHISTLPARTERPKAHVTSPEQEQRAQTLYHEGIDALARGDVRGALSRVRLAASMSPLEIYDDLIAHLETTVLARDRARARKAAAVHNEMRGLQDVASEPSASGARPARKLTSTTSRSTEAERAPRAKRPRS